MGSAPEAKQHGSGDGHRQKQAHPDQFIGGTAGPLVDADGQDGSDQQEERVDVADVFLKENGQQKGGENLGQDRQDTERDAGCSGDTPFNVFVFYGMPFSAHCSPSPFRGVSPALL